MGDQHISPFFGAPYGDSDDEHPYYSEMKAFSASGFDKSESRHSPSTAEDGGTTAPLIPPFEDMGLGAAPTFEEAFLELDQSMLGHTGGQFAGSQFSEAAKNDSPPPPVTANTESQSHLESAFSGLGAEQRALSKYPLASSTKATEADDRHDPSLGHSTNEVWRQSSMSQIQDLGAHPVVIGENDADTNSSLSTYPRIVDRGERLPGIYGTYFTAADLSTETGSALQAPQGMRHPYGKAHSMSGPAGVTKTRKPPNTAKSVKSTGQASSSSLPAPAGSAGPANRTFWLKPSETGSTLVELGQIENPNQAQVDPAYLTHDNEFDQEIASEAVFSSNRTLPIGSTEYKQNLLDALVEAAKRHEKDKRGVLRLATSGQASCSEGYGQE